MPALHHSLKRIPKKDVLIKINRQSYTQRDFPESAKYERISKIQENQPDSENRLDSRNPTDTRPRLSTNESSSSTARHSSRISAWSGSHREEAPWTYSGSWGYLLRAKGPFYTCYSLVILCPFCGLLVYGHRPFDLAHGLFSLCLRALSSYAYGPFFLMPTGPLFIPAGPCPNCYLVD